MKKISKFELNNIVKSQVNEGFWDSVFGEDVTYISLSKDLEAIVTKIVNRIYYDQDTITNIRELYEKVKSAKIDRRDKKELMDLMLSMYQTMEFSRQKLETLTRKMQRLRM